MRLALLALCILALTAIMLAPAASRGAETPQTSARSGRVTITRLDDRCRVLIDGDLVLPPGKSLTLRYRFLFHEGDAEQAKIADRYRAYAAEAASYQLNE